MSFTLSNGTEIPALGMGCAFGNWTDESKPILFTPEDAWSAVSTGLEAGYRHFDGALVYGSQKNMGIVIGMALMSGKAKREDFWITSKCAHPPVPLTLNTIPTSFDFESPEFDLNKDGKVIRDRIMQDFERTLYELGMGYVDLLLVHWPGVLGSTSKERNSRIRKEIWAAYEEIYALKKARAIGVSNYTCAHIKELLEYAKVPPMVNQIEINPFNIDEECLALCQSNNIHVTAWAPFGSGATGVLTNPTILEIGKKYGKNAGQVILRWLFQLGCSALPKSSSATRMKGNLQIFDFEITKAEQDSITALNTRKTSVISPATIP